MKQTRLYALAAIAALCLPPLTHAGVPEAEMALESKNFHQAIKELKPLADSGNPWAQAELGIRYYLGQGIPQDYKEAAKWFRLAADRGGAVAQNNLGVMYANGYGVPQDYKEAAKWYRLAADQGYAVAQENLGGLYANGRGVPQDYKEAAKWYRLAVDQGNAVARHSLGVMYANGRGVPQDYKEAVKWYRLAADQGYANAQNNLGVMYDKGQGVPQDYKEAVKWYRLAADQGYAVAQENLGLMHTDGLGVAASRVIAYALLNLSATNDGSKENRAAANRGNLEGKMSPREIEAAQDLTRELAKPGNLLKALDKYAQNPMVKERSNSVPAREGLNPGSAPAPAGDGYPARPAKRPGVVSCNTNCINADCRRTYDDGRKIRFTAQRKFDPFSGEWKIDAGGC